MNWNLFFLTTHNYMHKSTETSYSVPVVMIGYEELFKSHSLIGCIMVEYLHKGGMTSRSGTVNYPVNCFQALLSQNQLRLKGYFIELGSHGSIGCSLFHSAELLIGCD